MSDVTLLPNYNTIKSIIQQPATVETLFDLPPDQIEFLIDECDIYLKDIKFKFLQDFETLKPYLLQLKELKIMIDKLREKRNAYATFMNMDRADCWLALDLNEKPFPIKTLEEKYEIYKSKKSPTNSNPNNSNSKNSVKSPTNSTLKINSISKTSKDDIEIVTEMKMNKQRSGIHQKISLTNTKTEHENDKDISSPPLPKFQPDKFQKGTGTLIAPKKIEKMELTIPHTISNNTSSSSKIPDHRPRNMSEQLSKTTSYLPQPKFVRSILKK